MAEGKAPVDEQVPDWLRELIGASWAARESFRMMHMPHSGLERALGGIPPEVKRQFTLPI